MLLSEPLWYFGKLSRVVFFMMLSFVQVASGEDWPQYMRDASHSANSVERWNGNLGIDAKFKLDDAILTSPAVVSDRVFVVDQMGTAYCIDFANTKLLWKSSPPGANAVGANTSSPCVVNDTVAYGTTSGQFHLLSALNGQVIRTIDLGESILGAITHANDSFYLQTLDGVIHCLDLSGDTRWQYDPYRDASTKPGSRYKRQYSGVAITVSGERVFAAVGFDIVCLRDEADSAKLIWKKKRPISDTYLPSGLSCDDTWLYASFPGKDGKGAVVRLRLDSGVFDEDQDSIADQWAVLTPPAIRDERAYYCRQAFGLAAARFGSDKRVEWSTFSDNPESTTPAIASPILAGDHCLFTTLDGRIGLANVSNPSLVSDRLVTISTPTGACITSSPAYSNGAFYFGDDAGYLYRMRPNEGGSSVAPSRSHEVFRSKSVVKEVGDRRYGWPSAFGGPRNSNFVDDPAVRPPFRLRWATKCGGLFKQAVCATEKDVVAITLGGLVICREQMTGRIRWRRHLSGQAWCRSALMAAEGRIYVPRMFRYAISQVIGREVVSLLFGWRNGRN